MSAHATTPTYPRDAVEARIGLPVGDAPEWIMWMPAGRHKITASKRGSPLTLTVQVDSETADVMQRTLSGYLAAGRQRPFFDFDHRREAASAWPLEFAWREEPEAGVYARVEWSDPGRTAVLGKAYRSFSPSFFESIGSPSRVEGAPLCMGSLLNDPAFDAMAPIWSGRSALAASPQKEQRMSATPSELAAMQARVAELETKNAELQAQAESSELTAAVEAAKAEGEQLRQELNTLKSEVEARRRRDADAVVASAVGRGALAPKDEAGQKRWRELILQDPANADLLAKLPGKPAVTASRVRPAVEVIKPDTNDILRGYIQAGSPREAGMLYRREISPLIEKGENVLARYPVEATDGSNTLGTLANALVSQRVLELVVSKRPMLRGVVTDFSDEVKSKGDTVKTRTIGLPSVENFGSAATETADTDVTVTLDLFKQVLYSFTADEIVGTSRNLVAERSEALAIALGNGMVDALAALITETNFGTTNQTILASASVEYGTIVAIAKAMNTAGVPDMGRFGWINSDVAAAMRNDEVVMAYFNREPMATAYAHWRNINGFENIWEFPALPHNSVNLTGFFASRSALIVAARVPRNPQELVGTSYPGLLRTITDPVTGLSVLQNEWIDPSSWAVNSRLITLFGVDLGNAAVGHTLVHTA